MRNALDDLNRKVDVVFQSRKRGCPGLFLKEFTGYKWPIALENVHADHLTTEDSRLRIVKALELVLPQPFNGYDQGSVTESHKGLFSFGSLRVRSCQSVTYERALSSDEEIVLQRLKDMGVQVHETYIEPKHGALSSYEAELRTPLSQYLQQRGIMDGTEFDQCYIDINNSTILESREGFRYSWAWA